LGKIVCRELLIFIKIAPAIAGRWLCPTVGCPSNARLPKLEFVFGTFRRLAAN
jgi:hypothetical protein